jgi:hypothetical protein
MANIYQPVEAYSAAGHRPVRPGEHPWRTPPFALSLAIPCKERPTMKKLLFLIIAGGLVYLNYTNPTREDHEEFLLAEMQALGPVSEEQFAKATRDIDFSNFMVCSATKTSLDSKMITLGYLKEVKLVNDKWIRETVQKLQGRQ